MPVKPAFRKGGRGKRTVNMGYIVKSCQKRKKKKEKTERLDGAARVYRVPVAPVRGKALI